MPIDGLPSRFRRKISHCSQDTLESRHIALLTRQKIVFCHLLSLRVISNGRHPKILHNDFKHFSLQKQSERLE
jgi:hypothetical protein